MRAHANERGGTGTRGASSVWHARGTLVVCMARASHASGEHKETQEGDTPHPESQPTKAEAEAALGSGTDPQN